MSKIYMPEITQFISRYTLLNRSVCLLFNKPFFYRFTYTTKGTYAVPYQRCTVNWCWDIFSFFRCTECR